MIRLIVSHCGCREGYLGDTDAICVEWTRCGTHGKPSDMAKSEKARDRLASADPDDIAYVQRRWAGN